MCLQVLLLVVILVCVYVVILWVQVIIICNQLHPCCSNSNFICTVITATFVVVVLVVCGSQLIVWITKTCFIVKLVLCVISCP